MAALQAFGAHETRESHERSGPFRVIRVFRGQILPDYSRLAVDLSGTPPLPLIIEK